MYIDRIVDGVLKALYPDIGFSLTWLCVAGVVILAGLAIFVFGLYMQATRVCPEFILVMCVGIVLVGIPCMLLKDTSKEYKSERRARAGNDEDVCAHVQALEEHLRSLEVVRRSRQSVRNEADMRMDRLRNDVEWLENYRRKERR